MTLDQIAASLRDAESVLLVAHVNPDADALGSTLATAIALESLGTEVSVTFADDPFAVPSNLAFLPRLDLLVDPGKAHGQVAMSMDASSADRLGRVLPIARAASTFIAIDHHASFEPFADINLCDPSQPATGMLALGLLDALGVRLNHDIATCLYAAVSSDTGSFRYPATTPHALRVAARLMETGIDFAAIAKALFDTRSRGFVHLHAQVMQDLEVRDLAGLAVAVAHVPRSLREHWGVSYVDTEPMIDSVRTLEGIDVAIVLKEDDTGNWRVSTRSLGSTDVGVVCSALGGGGHRLAAGFTGSHDAQQTLERLLGALAA